VRYVRTDNGTANADFILSSSRASHSDVHSLALEAHDDDDDDDDDDDEEEDEEEDTMLFPLL